MARRPAGCIPTQVDAILRISVDGPEAEKYQPNRMVEHWYLSGRNPDTSSLKESFNTLF